MISLAMPNLGENEPRCLQECTDTAFVSSMGPFVDRFEAAVAGATGAPHAVATSSGTPRCVIDPLHPSQRPCKPRMWVRAPSSAR